jgi:uncharacterized protein
VIVVCNTSPIINLAMIGQLEVLQKLYGKVIIPEAVRQEITVRGAGEPGATEVEESDWIEACEVENRSLVASLQLELDAGEAEAIALAVELEADLLLLDERKGRVIASRLGLKFVGLLAVLIEAKQKGVIAAIKPVVDALIEKAGFWIDQELYKRVLQAAGE